jgi:hypothetical protein
MFLGKTNLLNVRLDELLKRGVMSLRLKKDGSRIAWGDRYKATLYKGFALDVFIVLPDRQWGPTMVIRTGPGDANGALVTQQGVTNHDGNIGVCPAGMKFENGAVWGEGGAPYLDTPEEIDVFAALGLPWIPPHLRSPGEYFYQQYRRHVPKVEMMLAWDEFVTRSHIGGHGPHGDGVYLPEHDAYVALEWAAGHGPRPSVEVVEEVQMSMFGKAVEYG